MNSDDTLTILGLTGLSALVIFVIMVFVLPAICAIIVGVKFASMLMLTGYYWWAFIILFVWICVAIVYRSSSS